MGDDVLSYIHWSASTRQPYHKERKRFYAGEAFAVQCRFCKTIMESAGYCPCKNVAIITTMFGDNREIEVFYQQESSVAGLATFKRHQVINNSVFIVMSDGEIPLSLMQWSVFSELAKAG